MSLSKLTAKPAQELPDAEQNAARAKKAIWAIFLVALVLGVGLRWVRTDQLADDLEPVMEEIHAVLKGNREASTSEIQKVLAERLRPEGVSDDPGSDDTARRYAPLVRILAYRSTCTEQCA